MTGVFLQVRLSSSRLPNKALLSLSGKSVIEHAMDSLRRVPSSVHAVLTDDESAPLLERVASRAGFELFVGSPTNVLERYVAAARRYAVDEVVRATGDNPLVSWELARLAVSRLREHGADYFGFDGPPLGTGVEVCRAEALSAALRETRDPYDFEHVTPYLYRTNTRFVAIREEAPRAYTLPQARVTLDTREDYLSLQSVMEKVYDGGPTSIFRLVEHLRTRSAGHFSEGEHAYSDRA
ncbi:MAG: cytidylyltransferase domain-containing protein [Spirochaetales bacterium]